MNNTQVLFYGMLESTNDLEHFYGTHSFKKLIEFRNFIEIFYCCMTRLRNKK